VSRISRGPVPLYARGDAPPPKRFVRGAHEPFGIRWFGTTALPGQIRHLAAEAFASGQLDSRDWMRAQQPAELLNEVARVLEAPAAGSTLTERLGRDVWIDFVADAGDDSDVSSAVARMVFSEYEVQDGSGRVLPRGDLLIFGGDTAYPLSSAWEAARRLTHPWNRVLKRLGQPERARALLGIPGNHDWYDGLDGFARLFRRDPLRERVDHEQDAALEQDLRLSEGPSARESGRAFGRIFHHLHLDEVAGSLDLLEDAVAGAFAVLAGRKVKRLSRLWLVGYRPVQEASYWLLPLAPNLDVWGVDRELRTMDFRQRLFFNRRKATGAAERRILVAPDPAIAMGETNRPGADILRACGLNLKQDPVCFLTGDSHHYERRVVGPSMHVIAGGGGAFLHGTRVLGHKRGKKPACAFPDQATSRRLAAQVPFKLVAGTGGLLLHVLCAGLAALQLWAFRGSSLGGWIVTALVAALGVLIMWEAVPKRRERPWATMGVALGHGAVLALVPPGVGWLLSRLVPPPVSDVVNVLVCAFAGTFVIGHFLLALVLTGLEHHQAFAVLGHPGFKHFVRLCVHTDGRVEAWTIGKADTLGEGPPEQIDRFEW